MKRIPSGVAAAVAVFGLIGLVLAPTSSWAAPILLTDVAQMSSPIVVDFSQFSGSFNFTTGPVQVGGPVGLDINYSAQSSNSVIGNGGYGLAGNGFWNSLRNGYVGTNSGNASSITFTFNSGPVSAVGGFVNYAPGTGSAFTITALAADNTILGSFNIGSDAPILTPSTTNQGAFRGIEFSSNVIAAFQISGSFAVLDNLTFSALDPIVTPEPTTMAIWTLVGVVGMVYGKRRRTQRFIAKDATA